MRRRALLGVFLGLCIGNLRAEAKIVPITAKKFEFTPAEITLKAGEPVVLELTTEDVAMGFSLPELKLQAEIAPGKTTRVAFTPQRLGRYEYICDVFCGEGHEDMGGVIKVVA